ncbi:inorganic diphosphatase [Nonlabens sp.]
MTKHAWHDVSYGADAPGNVTGIIEIPKNTRAKYELDKESGMLILDRVIYSSMYYPTNYGFIPQTYCDDNDPLDILVLSQIEIVPMCLVECKVIGVMQMLDGGEMDDKIIAVAANDMSVAHFNDIEELPEFWKKEMRNFFQDYKKLENKEVKVDEFQGREKALEIVNQSIVDYKKKFGTK